MAFASDGKYLTALREMIDRWRDERKPNAPSTLLPGYLSLNGLKDGWAMLLAMRG
jgi:hypothetical protein